MLSAAAVCGFEAFINGKHIVGEVKEKEQAHREYKEAISKGHGAYLMDEDEETPVSGGRGEEGREGERLPCSILNWWTKEAHTINSSLVYSLCSCSLCVQP